VPIEVVEPFAVARVVGPTVVRIGPDRTLLDAPWEMFGCTVTHVWPDERVAGGWARVEWPVDISSRRPIAPLDLHLGHVLELAVQRDGRGSVLYAIAADVTQYQMILVPAASALQAVSTATRAIDVWRRAEIRAASDEWLDRHTRGEPCRGD
jgi:hypothetical protein